MEVENEIHQEKKKVKNNLLKNKIYMHVFGKEKEEKNGWIN